MVIGLDNKDMKRFKDLLIKANEQQLSFLEQETSKEILRRKQQKDG